MVLEVALDSPLMSLEVSSRVAARSADVCLVATNVDCDGDVKALANCVDFGW